MTKKFFALIVLVAILLTACSVSTKSAPSYYSQVEKMPQAAAPAMPSIITPGGATNSDSARGLAGPGQTTSAYSSTQPTDSNRLVIKNANLSIYVDDPTQSMDRISALADEMGGFVVSANLTQTYLDNGDKVPHAAITIRVPAERLAEALSRIKAETKQPVINETISSQDVTSQYTDLQSQLTNLEAAEKQLQNIMDQATKTEDVLNVYNQLVSVRGQIEVIKGQMKYYEQSAALSAISVDLTANAASQPLKIGGWQPVGVAKEALQSLIRTVQVLLNVVIYLVLLVLPVAALIFLPPFFAIRALLGWRTRRKALAKPILPV